MADVVAADAESNDPQEKYSQRLSLWDSRSNCLAPLTENQIRSVVELSTHTKRPYPSKVCLAIFIYQKMLCFPLLDFFCFALNAANSMIYIRWNHEVMELPNEASFSVCSS